MPQRIVSARDQVEMLSPWLREASIEVPYMRNNNGMRKYYGPDDFEQNTEPWGRYMSHDSDQHVPLQPGWERGTVSFDNPLMVPHEYGGWKQNLSQEFGGATGRQLSQALLDKGHDGIITHDKYGIGEVVDIRPKNQRGHRVGMPTYYHFTDAPNFTINPQHQIQDDGANAGYWPHPGPGLFVSPEGRADEWGETFDNRKYRVELHSPKDLNNTGDPDPFEIFVPKGELHNLQVKRVEPVWHQAMSEIYDEYAGHHQAPGPGTGFPVHDMTGDDYGGGLGGVPEDWYTHPHYYSQGEVSKPEIKRVQQLYNQVRGNPEHPVDVYRALPHGNTTFQTGDWVTPSLEYAQQHGRHADDPSQDWPVIKTTTPAKNLWQNGDSYYEFGYHGPKTPGTLAR
jgi:hypothetical protein